MGLIFHTPRQPRLANWPKDSSRKKRGMPQNTSMMKYGNMKAPGWRGGAVGQPLKVGRRHSKLCVYVVITGPFAIFPDKSIEDGQENRISHSDDRVVVRMVRLN